MMRTICSLGLSDAQHVLAERLLGDALDEVVGDVEVDVGLEQGGADLLQPVPDVGFGDAAPAAQLFQRFRQTSLNAVKHAVTLPFGSITAHFSLAG